MYSVDVHVNIQRSLRQQARKRVYIVLRIYCTSVFRGVISANNGQSKCIHYVLYKLNVRLTYRVYHLSTNAKSCSDWAEIFSIASFIYLKNIIFYVFDFLSRALLKVINDIVVFI